MNTDFTLELIQAINDWQIGGLPSLKKKRGGHLRKMAESLPNEFTSVNSEVYRKINLNGKDLIYLGTHYKLSETISAWTTQESVAKSFKGGVSKIQSDSSVILKLKPSNDRVVINLEELYLDDCFQKFIQDNKGKIKNFEKGIGKYSDSQHEVVIEVEEVSVSALYSWGGFSSDVNILARQFYGKKPSPAQLNRFKCLLKTQKIELSQGYWLKGSQAVERINEILIFHANRLNRKAISIN